MRRAGTACICLLHVVAAAVVGVGDAVLDGKTALVPVHVEHPGHTDCAFHYGGFVCQLARSPSLAGASQNVDLADPGAPTVLLVDFGRDTRRFKTSSIMTGSVIPRGPPAA